MQLQLEKAKTIARCSLSLMGSLHPATRHAVRELVNQIGSHFLEQLDCTATPPDADEGATFETNMSPDRFVIAVVKHHANRVWREPYLMSVQLQRDLQPVVDGLWSVSAAATREIRQGVADERDDVDRLLDALLDEAKRMEKVLASDQMKARLQDMVRLRGYDQAVALPLHYIYVCGPITIAEFEQMMGRGARSMAAQTIARLFDDGLLQRDEQGLEICFSLNAAATLMPELFW